MFFKKKNKNQVVRTVTVEPSFVSHDTTFEGNVICDGEIHIDGAVRGTIRAQTCLIEKHGEVLGAIIAENIFIHGRMIGPIEGRHVQVYAGAHVEGDITNETISIENGSFLLGNIRRVAPNVELNAKLDIQPIDNVLPLKSQKVRA